MDIKTRATEILKIQREAVDKLTISPVMIQAIQKIAEMKNRGKIITTGMGKAGIIAIKMSATLASIVS